VIRKSSVDDLVMFGGTPAFTDWRHVGRPNIGDRARLLARINELLDRRWLTNDGPFVHELEAQIAQRVGIKHCVAMCNATIALEIAIRAAGLSGEVIVPSFTFVATAHALQWQAITPVFCDVDRRTHTLDPRQLERLITPRTTGILGVHLWGRACDVDEVAEVARRRGLKLLFDAAHAFGCSYKGKMIGNFGDAEVFSFHATKFLNSMEGGALVTNDDAIAHRARLMRNFGFTGYDDVAYIGTNGKMTEVAAAMGLTSLEHLEEFIATNHRNYWHYRGGLADIPGITLVEYDEAERSNYQYIVVEVDGATAGLTRDELQEILWAEGVLARRYFFPGCHRMEPYCSYFPNAGLLLPTTEWLSSRVLSLPTGTGTTADQIADVCGIIRFIVVHAAEIRTRFSRELQPRQRPEIGVNHVALQSHASLREAYTVEREAALVP
jgi:dTDP-4-amino-4,6-dideoxygalactose transaminase